MCPDFLMLRPPTIHTERGIGLPIALFVITVLALLVVGMAQLQQGSGQSISLQIQSQRAFHAAESGAQLGVGEVLDSGSCAAIPASIAFNSGALTTCEAVIACSASDPLPLGGGGGNRVFTLVSTGQCGLGNELARRAVEVRVR